MPNTRLPELLRIWKRTYEAGQYLPPEDLCAEHGCPDLVDALKEQIVSLAPESVASVSRPTADPYVTSPSDEFLTNAGSLSDTHHDFAPCAATARYLNLRSHAKGGLGEVFVAGEADLRRDVALKFIHTRLCAQPETVAGFLNEATITAQLEHPGIVPVYGLGRTPDGRPFYAMRFIKGQTLDEALETFHNRVGTKTARYDLDVEFRNLLVRFVAVCNAIAYAHNRRIIHRDIKPHNVMLGKYGETLVVDWGLAMLFAREHRPDASSAEATIDPRCRETSSSGSHAGTPAYMSPEQAAGEPLGPASDIYSLGATLYKILTGHAPYKGATVKEVMQKVKDGSFTPPVVDNRNVPRGLDAICRRALSRNPAARYPSADELGRDVERWLADAPVTALPESPREKAARWLRRHRAAALSIGTALLGGVVVATCAAVFFLNSANTERLAKERSLKAAATFTANAMAAEIDRRWLILEKAAAEPRLHEILADIAREADQRQDVPRGDALRAVLRSDKRLAAWVKEQFGRYDRAATAASWFVNDADGYQLARHPPPSAQDQNGLGANFAYRTWFHGGEEDHTDKAAAERSPQPITEPNLAPPMLSTTDGKLCVAFSVPIGRDDLAGEKQLGVLAMRVDLDAFNFVNTQETGLQGALVSTRLDAQKQRGLFVHHQGAKLANLAGEPIHLQPETLARIDEHFPASTLPARVSAPALLISDYPDPLFPSSRPTLAAVQQVAVKNWQADRMNRTGLLVIIQELD